jgi:hypothetical protein
MLRALLLLATTACAAALEIPKPTPGLGRRAALSAMPPIVIGSLTTAGDCRSIASSASAAESPDDKTQFKRLSPIQFIAALGDGQASSGTGAENWRLWREDPGPRGVYLRDYDKKLAAKGGVAPAGWSIPSNEFWVEEHGLIMEKPGPLPLQKFAREGDQIKVVSPQKRYVVTGDRQVTSVLTVSADGKWSLSKGSLYDVTHLPCRTGVYTAPKGGMCTPTAAMQQKFPVPPGALMPTFDGCRTEDWAVLFVLGVEV